MILLNNPSLVDQSASYAQQQARFLSPSLRELLEQQFHAQLAGSWATGEAHLPLAVRDRIKSLSDIDVLVSEPPTREKITTIVQSVQNLSWEYGVEISKVSVRYQLEIDAFWDFHKISELSESRLSSGRFITFWALIGAIEALSSSEKDSSEDGRSYFLVKFFFKLCRNILLIKGYSPATYRDLTAATLSRLISHSAVLRAYAIKVGQESMLSFGDCEVLLSDSNWELLTNASIDARSNDLLANIRKNMREWYKTGALFDLGEYLGQIKAFTESPELLPAYTKVIRDYECRDVSITA